MNTNPYEPLAETPRSRPSLPAWRLVLALFFLALTVLTAATAVVASTLSLGRPPKTQRYATYDSELLLFGIPIDPDWFPMVSWIALPLFLLVSVFLFRPAWGRKSSANTDTGVK